MLSYVLCEDGDAYLRQISAWLKDIAALRNQQMPSVIAFRSGEDLLASSEALASDVFFLDIDLGNGMSGLETANAIRRGHPLALIVFLSEHLECVFQSFQCQPFDFLPKPVTRQRLEACIRKLEEAWLARRSAMNHPVDFLTVRFSSVVHHIRKTDIVFIEKFRNKSVIHTLSGDIACYEPFDFFQEALKDSPQFFRCHKSYMANRDHIREIHLNSSTICFHSGQICYIGRTFRKGVTRI